MNRTCALIGIVVLSTFAAGNALSYEPDLYERGGTFSTRTDEALVVNRPPSLQGLTGLMFMNTAFTRKAGNLALGITVLGENSDTPDYSIVQGNVTLTLGLADNIEIGAKAKMIYTDIGSSTTQQSGLGDSEVALKWRIRSQSEGGSIPALALGIGGILPTGDRSKGFEEVTKNGLKIMVIASSETRVLDSSFVGVHFEAQAVLVDQITRDDPPTQEMYGVINAGLNFSLNEDNSAQIMVEYNQVVRKDIPTLDMGNYTGVSLGLRYVSKFLTWSAGGQVVTKEDIGFEDTLRLVGMLSLNY